MKKQPKPKPPAKPPAVKRRPTKFSTELWDTICARLSDGEPLTVICREAGMPSRESVYEWSKKPELSPHFARAREAGDESLFEQCLSIADDERHDWKLTQKGAVTNEVSVGRAKLQVWTRLQLLARRNPKRYGDKVDVNAHHTGGVTLTNVMNQINARGLPADDDDA